MPSRSFTALDGSTVRISSTSLTVPRNGATGFVIARFGSHRQEFGRGDRDLGKSIARAHDLTFDEEYRFQGGRLRLGVVEKYDPEIGLRETFRLGVWEGRS